ncbi:MAG TPA: hypothetical protein VET23_04720 [Chitinophagaceae bacterium]|nr:hypothetical protein [Chitinophagaceae bacterium]
MKKIIFLNTIPAILGFALPTIITAVFFISCTKESKKDSKEAENACPAIAATAVPQVVKDSFAVHYPSMPVITWFKKDSIGYCAYFIQPVNQKKLAEFSGTGLFLSEEIDLNHDGNFEDSASNSNIKIPGVCECEIPE